MFYLHALFPLDEWHLKNGLDNSGDTGHFKWVGNLSSDGAAIYQHWDIRGGDWAGPFNAAKGTFDSINETNIVDSLRVINTIIETLKDDPAIIGLSACEWVLCADEITLSF